MPQGSGPNTALARAIGKELKAATPEGLTAGTQKEALQAFVTSREMFEDLEPFRKDQDGAVQKTLHSHGGHNGGLGVSAWLLSLGGDRKLTRPFLQNPWVYASITANGKAMASLPVWIEQGAGDDATRIEAKVKNLDTRVHHQSAFDVEGFNLEDARDEFWLAFL